jgi:hypothetical protein
MGVYHQLGDKSVNLLNDQRLSKYRGAILSPVNYSEAEVESQVRQHQGFGYELIFDPQLYFPKSGRGYLSSWSYYPKDVDTADLSSSSWWSDRIAALGEVTRRLRPAAVCSPATAPRVYGAGYYATMIAVADELRAALKDDTIEVLPTIIANLRDHSDPKKVLETASIITKSGTERAYLVFSTEVDPRRELNQAEDIAGGMYLIRTLEEAGIRLLIGFTCTDIILWKRAGATDCASGKFFNLRRFTPSRFDPPSQGGGQLSYWFEESLLAFLREPDLVQVRGQGLISSHSKSNPYCAMILDELQKSQPSWLGHSWRQFLFWFQEVESRLRNGETSTNALLANAKKAWQELKANDVFLDEPMNNGHWVEKWEEALTIYQSLN